MTADYIVRIHPKKTLSSFFLRSISVFIAYYWHIGSSQVPLRIVQKTYGIIRIK